MPVVNTDSRIFRVFAGILVLTVLLAIATVPRVGLWLVVQQDLESADALVVLMGSTVDRVLEAHDLYSQDMASQIIMVQSRQVGGAYA